MHYEHSGQDNLLNFYKAPVKWAYRYKNRGKSVWILENLDY